MTLNFQVKRNGADFVVMTGVPNERFSREYVQESTFLSTFTREGDDYIVPRHQLCSVLDRCFDHFSEESLIHITKLLDKNEDAMRERIHEQSVSKRKKERRHERREETTPAQTPVKSQSVPSVVQESRATYDKFDRYPSERVPEPDREPIPVRTESRMDREPIPVRSESRVDREPIPVRTERVDRQERYPVSERSLRDDRRPVEDELSKTEVLKLFYQIKSQMDVLERYLHRVK